MGQFCSRWWPAMKSGHAERLKKHRKSEHSRASNKKGQRERNLHIKRSCLLRWHTVQLRPRGKCNNTRAYPHSWHGVKLLQTFPCRPEMLFLSNLSNLSNRQNQITILNCPTSHVIWLHQRAIYGSMHQNKHTANRSLSKKS